MFRYDRSSPASPMTTAATVPGRQRIGLVRGDDRLAVELAPGVVGGEHEQRPAGVAGRGVGGGGRGPRDDPVRVDRAARPCANQPASVSRWSCEKLVTTRNGMPRWPSDATASTDPGSGFALEDEDAVGIEDEAAHARAAPLGAADPCVIRRW